MTLGPISGVRVCVRDLDRSRTFFRDVIGFRETWSGDAATFDIGAGVSLVVETAEPDDAEGQGLIGRFMGVSFSTPDAQRAYEDLRACGVDFLEPPEEQPWGGILVHFRDPDGNVFSIVQLPSLT